MIKITHHSTEKALLEEFMLFLEARDSFCVFQGGMSRHWVWGVREGKGPFLIFFYCLSVTVTISNLSKHLALHVDMVKNFRRYKVHIHALSIFLPSCIYRKQRKQAKQYRIPSSYCAHSD